MSKHMKKLISTLLCGAMLLSSMSLGAFAEGTDTAADAADTAVTTSAEATVAPTADTAADDEYFNSAIGLLSALKIFEGYEDGSIKPESTITRAEMAAVILRTIGNKSLTKYTGMFTDVDASHWAADTIQTAADLGIINGMGDGTFAPDAPVKYEQAIKMVVCALNYGAYAEYNGGYPMGYITLAGRTDLQLTKSIGGAYGTDATRGTIVKLVYNAVNAPYPTLTGFDALGPVYSTEDDKTLASEKHDVYIGEGILTATPTKAIDLGAVLLDTQVAIDGDVFESSLTNADDLVGQYIKFYYYDESGNGAEEKIIYAYPVLNKNNTLTIDALKVDTFENLDGSAPKLKYFSETNAKKTAKLVEDPIIVYNNEVLTKDKLPEMPNDYEGTKSEYFVDFITPDVGSIKLGDFDNDGKYDIVFVEKYITYVVNSSSTSKVTFKYEVDGKKNLDMDLEDSQYFITLTRDGETIKPRHLKEYEVLSVLMNAPYTDKDYTGDKKITAVASTATITGKSSAFDEDDDGNYLVYVDGKQYYVDAAAAEDVKDSIGNDGTFYLDIFDRIAYVESSAAGKLTGKEKYGWIMNAYVEEGSDVPTIKLFTQDGTVAAYEVDSEINYWDKSTGGAVKLDSGSDEGMEKLLSLKTATPYATSVASVRLCKYKVNSSNLLTQLYVATTEDSTKGVTVNTANMNGVGSIGSVLSGYKMSGDVLRFTVPSKNTEMASDVSTYKVESVAASNYLKYSTGVSEDFILAEFEDGKPTVMIKFVGSSDDLAVYTDTDTAADNSVMMVTKISKAVNDDDERVYIIKGYIGTGEVSFTTNKSTLIYDVNPAEASNPKEDYTTKEGQATGFWNGQMEGVNLGDYLVPGDIVAVHGNVYVRFASVANVAKDVAAGALDGANQFYGNVTKSETRDNVTFGKLNSVDVDGSAVVIIGDEGVGTDTREISADAAIIYVEVSLREDGSYTAEVCDSADALSVYDLEEFDMDSKTGDFVFKRVFKNGAERETYVIRFVD